MSARRRMPSYRPWGSTEDGNIEFESLTTETLDGALRVIRESFFPDENVSRAVDVTSEPASMRDLERLCVEAAKDGVSVVAIDVNTNEVVGVCFNKIQMPSVRNAPSFYESFAATCEGRSSRALIEFMNHVDGQIDLFKLYNVDCILEAMFLATLPSHKKRRIGELLISSTCEIGRELRRGKRVKTPVEANGDAEISSASATPALITAIMTSAYSQRIAAKLGFERLLEIVHDGFEFEGRKFSERIGPEHPYSLLVAKRLLATAGEIEHV